MGDERPLYTGRQIVVFADAVHNDVLAMGEALQSTTGAAHIASSLDFAGGAIDVQQADAADATVFAELGVAVLPESAGTTPSLAAAVAAERRIIAIEPERILYAIEEPPAGPSLEYLRGYRDATAHLYQQLSMTEAANLEADLTALADTAESTWGLQATRAARSRHTGKGIRVAVLDTGLDFEHPDYAGRATSSESFIPGETQQDGHGHGTHCAGTACGGRPDPSGRRYGIAREADLYVGKVLSNGGRGGDGNVLAGINWAVANRVHVVSMSLGIDIRAVSTAYEVVGQRALDAGTLLIAAAGNNASRATGHHGFVGVPANSPSIMAVAAVDAGMQIAGFSARSNPVDGGQVDIAAPGVGIHSSWPMPLRYRALDGTSMATPHVAGLAALFAQATGATGAQLWSTLTRSARRLRLPSADVGVGLAQAPR